MSNQNNEPTYSKDIWDYLNGQLYLPNRLDREKLQKARDKKRLQIWEFFFRFRPADIGIPQKVEIQTLEETIKGLEKQKQDYQSILNGHRRSRFVRVVLVLLCAFGAYFFQGINEFLPFVYQGLVIIGIILLFTIPFVDIDSISTINSSSRDIRKLRKRITKLENMISDLVKQAPKPLSSDKVVQWLNEDIKRLRETAIDQSGLETRLAQIAFIDESGREFKSENPIMILSPGELQSSALPEFFRIPSISNLRDLIDLMHSSSWNRFIHLRSAKQLVFLPTENLVDVIYGVYFAQFIFITDKILLIYSVFYDFITGETVYERSEEYYYQHIVSVSVIREMIDVPVFLRRNESELEKNTSFRQSDYLQKIEIQGAPKMRLEFTGGQIREIVIPSMEYLRAIFKALEMEEEVEGVLEFLVAKQSQQAANSAMKVIKNFVQRSGNRQS